MNIRRRRRSADDSTWTGLLAQQKALTVAPTVDTGFKSYGPSRRRFLPAADPNNTDGIISDLEYAAPTGSGDAATLVIVVTPEWAGNDGANHSLLSLSNVAGDNLLYVYKYSGNTIIGRVYLGSNTQIIGVSTAGWAAGSRHVIIYRVTASGFLDLCVDGVHTPPVANPKGALSLSKVRIAAYAWNGSDFSTGSHGPAYVIPNRKSDAWTTSVCASLMAGADDPSIFALLDSPNDLCIPLVDSSNAYRKLIGASPFDLSGITLAAFSGDSLVYGDDGNVVHGVNDLTAQTVALLGPSWRGISQESSGRNTSEIIASAATVFDPSWQASYGNTVFVFMEGINSMCYRDADAVHTTTNKTIAEELALWHTLCDARRTRGWGRIVVCTLPAGNEATRNAEAIADGYASWDAKRQAFNALLAANYTDFADDLADIGADPVLGDVANCSDGINYVNGLHWTALGNSIAAGILADTLT